MDGRGGGRRGEEKGLRRGKGLRLRDETPLAVFD